jgi:hypothetical protein
MKAEYQAPITWSIIAYLEFNEYILQFYYITLNAQFSSY